MRQFFMNGKVIASLTRFREHFEPRDLLRERELAAGFVMHHFSPINPRSLYHASVFYMAAFRQVSVSPLQNADAYCCNDFLLAAQNSQVRRMALKALAAPEEQQLREDLWKLTGETSLEEGDRLRLFFLLTAAYCLARRDLQSAPLTADEAQRAYLRQPEETVPRDSWLTFDAGSGDILLPASETPYKLRMGQGAQALLEQGVPITHRKIIALPHTQGDDKVVLTIELHPAGEGPVRLLRIGVDDYRYFNFVGNVPVHLHPRGMECRKDGAVTARLWREGKQLFSSRLSHPLEIQGMELYGFALETTGDFILLTSDGVKYNHYAGKNQNFFLPKKDIVEAAFRDGECLLLHRSGQVLALNSGRNYPGRVACLSDLPHFQL